ncbi:unnamed protein product [Colias eurytheme]|nr:unnamed protein product [Colias eurytheme]
MVEIKCPSSAYGMDPEETIRQKKVDFWKYASNSNQLVVNTKHTWYPNLPIPSRETMLAATQRLRDYGKFQHRMDSGRRPRRTVHEHEEILEFFEADPTASTNDAARRFNVSQYFAWSVIHNEGKYPFHLHRVQEITESDKPVRVKFFAQADEEAGQAEAGLVGDRACKPQAALQIVAITGLNRQLASAILASARELALSILPTFFRLARLCKVQSNKKRLKTKTINNYLLTALADSVKY